MENKVKNCIITPTFEGHFKYISDYLKSFQINANPKDNFEICFTISKNEAKAFSKITQKFSDLNINTLFFEDILSHFNITDTPSELLQKYGKYSFQTLKKFYTMLYLGKEYRFLVLDSESILYRPYNINQIFDDFFKAPFISGTNLKYRSCGYICKNVKKSTSFLLEKETSIWFLENFVWFYDFKILSDLFEKYGTPFQMVDRVYGAMKKNSSNGIFEIDLYQTYIYHNLDKYSYRFIDLDKEFKAFKDNKTYRKIHQAKFGGECGLFEHIMLFLNKENVECFSNLLKKLNFNIIRCDETTVENYKLQKQFLDAVQPVILAASQDHYFGVKHNKKQLLKIILGQKNINKLKKHTYALTNPILLFLKWLKEPFCVIKYSIECFFIFIKCVIKMH